jgi:hypothetical protein
MIGFIKDTGRFGIKDDSYEYIENMAEKIASQINLRIGNNHNVLIVGHGENIYIPSRIAAYLKGNVKFKTTTRSPIYVDGEIIKSRHYFMDNNIKYYFYNAKDVERAYDYVLFVNEFDLTVKLTKNAEVIKL